MLKFFKENYKIIILIIIASFTISFAKNNFKNKGSIGYLLSNEIFNFAGYDKNKNPITISKRLKNEIEKCGSGYAISDWIFEKDAQIYYNNSIWGCTASYYKQKYICPMNLKIYNSAYNQRYDLANEWFQDLLIHSSNKDNPRIYGCNLENKNNKCEFVEKNGFFKYQLFCSILNSISPTECDKILADKLRIPQYIEDYEGNLTELKKNNKQIEQEFINNIVRTRNPIKSFKFLVLKEKDQRFLRVIIFTDLDNSNKNCEDQKVDNMLISISKDLM